jgi:hypothetical protein
MAALTEYPDVHYEAPCPKMVSVLEIANPTCVPRNCYASGRSEPTDVGLLTVN